MIKRHIDGRKLTFRLDVPNVQRRGRIGSIKVFVGNFQYLIRVYGLKGNLCERGPRLRFEHALREAVNPEFLSELLGFPVTTFHYKRFNPSLALADGETATQEPIGALA